MKLKAISVIALLIGILAIACQSDEQLEFKRYYTSGVLLYQQKCQNCHGTKGEGLSNLIPPLTDTAYLKKNKAQLGCMVKYGIKETIITVNGKSYEGAMPATDLAPVEVAQVLTYIGNSFGNHMGTITSEQADVYLKECK
ncbi:cytochrome c [Inquilinus sp. KBS0705]|nr:cytochrome c [Inquilinus sp. KBS0705]